MLKQISIDALLPGHFVTQVIKQNGPVKIRKVGIVKSHEMIKGLQEMGVSVLEIDPEQSLEIEIEEGMIATPTSRLVANAKDRTVEQVDRQLSQQFHNSLFMPAIEDMPSRWQLYAKPYSVTALLIILGFGVGFMFMQLPAVWEMINQQSSLVQSSAKASSDATGTIEADEQRVTELASDTQKQTIVRDSTQDKLEDAVVAKQADKQLREESDALESDLLMDATRPADLSNQSALMTRFSEDKTLPEPPPQVQGLELAQGERVLGYQGEELSGPTAENPGVINPQLLAKINQVVEQIDREDQSDQDKGLQSEQPAPSILRVDQLAASTQSVLPAMSFSAHMYASNPQDRWVRVNGRRLEEGDYVSELVQVIEIQAERVILDFQGQRFSINALSDWQ